ncbi:hypothetical protein RZ87_22635 [Enterobacter roggenkampii]|nr:hypothetical protein RZ87_22635 [Enterobacter roggenkampii]
MKACPVHEPPTAPIFMLPICAILTGINWHAFTGIIHLMQIRSQERKSHVTNKVLKYGPLLAKSGPKELVSNI